jgi:hypothetical protein
MLNCLALLGISVVLGASAPAMAAVGDLTTDSFAGRDDGIVEVLEQTASQSQAQSRKKAGDGGASQISRPSPDLPPSA